MRQFTLLCLSFFVSLGVFGQEGGIIRGKVVAEITGEALGYANVVLEGSTTGAITDDEGKFEIRNVKPGLYNVKVAYTGYKETTVYEVQVFNNKPAVLEIAMEEEMTAADTVVITASPFTKTAESPVSIHTIGVNEIERNPGGNRDISRVIQSLPGVATGVGFRNDIIIRGGSPNENRFYLDGIEVPNINHFATQGASGGPVGMINVNFIREVDFYTGAFPAARGNTLSSVMEIKQKNGRDDRIGANMTIGSSDAGLTLEGPIGGKTTFLASARRSYLQGLFKVIGLPFLPTYNDFQFRTHTKINAKTELVVLGLGAIDQFRLNLEADSTDQQKYILGYLPENEQWNYTMGANLKRFSKNGFTTFVASRNMLNNTALKFTGNDRSLADNKILDYTSQEIENKFRVEHTSNVKGFRINYGAGLEYVKYNNSTYNRISTPVGLDTISFGSALAFAKGSLFGTVSHKLLSDRLTLSLGLRSDANTYSTEMGNPLKQLSPRLSASYQLASQWSLNFNTGIYYQLPPYTILGYRDGAGTLVNKANAITYVRNKHVVGGIEHTTSNNGKFTLEGFYKDYDNYPFLTTDSISLANLGGDFGVVGNAPATSTSEGRTYGGEFMFQQKLYKGFFAILSYTFVRSEFTDGSGAYKPAAWDNRNIVTFTGGKKFKGNWELGARWRFYGGTPYTPIDVNRSSLINVWNITGLGLPDYSLLNTKRNPASHQLDMRLDKKWYFRKWALNLYLDIQNVYNFKSQAAPYMDVVKDSNGAPVVDPNDPARYQYKLIPNTNGTLLPSVGVVIEL